MRKGQADAKERHRPTVARVWQEERPPTRKGNAKGPDRVRERLTHLRGLRVKDLGPDNKPRRHFDDTVTRGQRYVAEDHPGESKTNFIDIRYRTTWRPVTPKNVLGGATLAAPEDPSGQPKDYIGVAVAVVIILLLGFIIGLAVGQL